MFSKNLLKSKMALFDEGQRELAVALGISPQRISAKMNTRKVADNVKAAQFTLSEVEIIMKRYNLTPLEVVNIFIDPDSTQQL